MPQSSDLLRVSPFWSLSGAVFRKLQLQVVIVLFLALYFAHCQSSITFIAVLYHSLLHSQWARFSPPTHVLFHAAKFHCTPSSISFYRVASFSHLCPLLSLGFVAACSILVVWSAALLYLKLKKHLCTEKLRWSRSIAGLDWVQGPLQTRGGWFLPWTSACELGPAKCKNCEFTPRSSFFKHKRTCRLSLSGRSSQVSEGQVWEPRVMGQAGAGPGPLQPGGDQHGKEQWACPAGTGRAGQYIEEISHTSNILQYISENSSG